MDTNTLNQGQRDDNAYINRKFKGWTIPYNERLWAFSFFIFDIIPVRLF